jgi:hypothetical protein
MFDRLFMAGFQLQIDLSAKSRELRKRVFQQHRPEADDRGWPLSGRPARAPNSASMDLLSRSRDHRLRDVTSFDLASIKV